MLNFPPFEKKGGNIRDNEVNTGHWQVYPYYTTHHMTTDTNLYFSSLIILQYI